MDMLYFDLQFFAKDGPGGEKTEEPTAKKLSDARKEGQVAKSREVNNAFGLLALFLILKFFIGTLGEQFLETYHLYFTKIQDIVKNIAGGMSIATAQSYINNSMILILQILAPFLAVGFALMFLVEVVQVGLEVSLKPMMPKFSKLNPISGFKRIFSAQALFELVKSIAKIAIISLVAYRIVGDSFGEIYLLYNISLKEAVYTVGTLAIDVGFYISLVYFLVAFSDLIYQRRKFHNDMKMTKQEVKDEYKNSEGNPEIKGKQRQKMREASQRRMMEDVKDADVVITNPTHLAIAITYKQMEMAAPVVVAKGQDYMAQKIKEKAKEFEVEIVENKPLARTLYDTVEIGDMIPRELYHAVAEVLAYVYSMRRGA